MFFRPCEGGVLVAVKATPNAPANRIGGLAQDADGRYYLKVYVAAAPEKGKANKALLKFLAGMWDVPASSLEITGAETSRWKAIRIAGDSTLLVTRLRDWVVHQERS